MALSSWLSPRRPERARRLRLETLEDRCVPATIAFSVLNTVPANFSLYRLDLEINSVTQVGLGTGFTGITGLAFGPNGVLYGVDDVTDRLVTIDTTTGVASTGTFGLLNVDVSSVGLSFDQFGNLYLADSGTSSLYTVNTTTGVATFFSNMGAPVTGLANIPPSGFLYGVTNAGALADFVGFDNTGTAIPIGPLGLNFTSGGIDYSQTGILYGLDNTGDIFIVNPATGQATVTVATNVAGFDGLAIQPAPPAPPPPPPPPPPTPLFAVGTNPNTQTQVAIYGANSITPRQILNPFPGFTGAIRVATGFINADLISDTIVSVSENGLPHVKVINGANGLELFSFYAFDLGYIGGVNVAATDFDGDGLDDIVVGTANSFSHVKVFSAVNLGLFASFFAYDGFSGGVSLGGGDVNGDGRGDVITGTAFGANHVKAFLGGSLTEFASFFTANAGLGIEVAGGDFNRDGRAEIVAAVSGPAVVEIFDSITQAQLAAYVPYPGYNSRIGVNTVDLNNDGSDDLITASLSGTSQAIVGNPLTGEGLASFIAFPSVRNPVPR